jgi:hypothetical protein
LSSENSRAITTLAKRTLILVIDAFVMYNIAENIILMANVIMAMLYITNASITRIHFAFIFVFGGLDRVGHFFAQSAHF